MEPSATRFLRWFTRSHWASAQPLPASCCFAGETCLDAFPHKVLAGAVTGGRQHGHACSSENKRAVNTFIPLDSLVVQTILRGETYRGSAFVVNNWQATAYQPIWIEGKIEGMLYVGLREYLPRLNQRISNVKLRKILENLVDVYFANSHGSSAIEKLIEFFTHAQQNATGNPFVELGLKELTVILKQIKEQRDLQPSVSTQQQKHPLSKVTDYIQKNLHENITIETLAQIAHISKPSLYRYFKEAYSLSPIDFINHERLTYAVKLMDSSPKNIQVIAQEVGFNNASYFIKLFHQRFGVTPKQYAKQITLSRELSATSRQL